MMPLLEVPAVRERVHSMPIETYHRLIEMGALSENVELLRGLIVTKMPKSPLHEYVAQMLMKLLLALLPPGFEVRPERPLSIGGSELEPDISVVSGRAADWMQAHPTTAALVIEVAVTSADIDEGKGSIYAEAGIPEYWIVRPDLRTVTVYRDPMAEGYRARTVLSDRDTLRCAGLPGVEITVASVLPPGP